MARCLALVAATTRDCLPLAPAAFTELEQKNHKQWFSFKAAGNLKVDSPTAAHAALLRIL